MQSQPISFTEFQSKLTKVFPDETFRIKDCTGLTKKDLKIIGLSKDAWLYEATASIHSIVVHYFPDLNYVVSYDKIHDWNNVRGRENKDLSKALELAKIQTELPVPIYE
ncbi:MAG: hypothetical protein PUP93_30830 [Rhizonema sp. NSF051]|nr:hypothetical protein [Rhizonema sp. NSF051]